MKMSQAIIFALLILFSISTIHAAEKAEKWNDGLYGGYLAGGALAYIVDPKTQMCFVSSAQRSVSPILCDSLAKRPEWALIITWVQK